MVLFCNNGVEVVELGVGVRLAAWLWWCSCSCSGDFRAFHGEAPHASRVNPNPCSLVLVVYAYASTRRWLVRFVYILAVD